MRTLFIAVAILMLAPLALAQQKDYVTIEKYTPPAEHKAFIEGYQRLVAQYPAAWTRFILVEHTGDNPHPAARSGAWVAKCKEWPGSLAPDCVMVPIE